MKAARFLLISLLLISLLLLSGTAQGHGTQGHGVPMTASRTTERIVLPDIPVTDQTGRRAGFVSRYGTAGPVIISWALAANWSRPSIMPEASRSRSMRSSLASR